MMKLNEMLVKRRVQISTFCPDYGCREEEEADGRGGGRENEEEGREAVSTPRALSR